MLQPIFTLNVFNDPTPDGLYGYRLKLLTERTSGFRFSVAELRAESKGIVGPGSKGAKTFWATPPTCPASGQVPFKAEFKYVGGQAQSIGDQGALPALQALGGAPGALARRGRGVRRLGLGLRGQHDRAEHRARRAHAGGDEAARLHPVEEARGRDRLEL